MAKPRKLKMMRRKAPRVLEQSSEPIPPQLKTNIMYSHTYRFTATAALSSFGVTNSMVLDSAGVVNTASATYYPILNSFKLNRIRIWAPPGALSSTTTVAINWVSGTFDPTMDITSTTNNPSVPAYLTVKPPPKSNASFWQIASTNNLFKITVPQGAIIDVSLTCLQSDQDITTVSVSGSAAGTLGQVYYDYLDGFTSGKLLPTGLVAMV